MRVVSLGGATEASIWSIVYEIGEVEEEWSSIPYGVAMENQKMYVLGEGEEERPEWVTGGIYIGGVGLARGYWRDEEKSRGSFIEVEGRGGERLYRTGDLGRYRGDGTIEFLGREDFQVKIGGHRIELGEIEAVLGEHPGVKGAVVTALGERTQRRLVGYVVMDAESGWNGNGNGHGTVIEGEIAEGRSAEGEAAEEEVVTAGVGAGAGGTGTGTGTAARMQKSVARPEESGELVMDPIARLKFKLTHPSLRQEEQAETILLKKPELDEKTIRERYIARRSYRQFEREEIGLEQFSRLLGCLLEVKLPGVPLGRHQYGSAGSLYPVQVYVYVKPGRVEGVEGGGYYYHPQEHGLKRLGGEVEVDGRLYGTANQAAYESSAFTLFLVAEMKAIRPMYGEWSRNFCLLEAGLMTQLLEMRAGECEMGLCQIGGLEFERVREYFGMEESHIYLHGMVGGRVEQKRAELPALVRETEELRLLLELIEEDVAGTGTGGTGRVEQVGRVGAGAGGGEGKRGAKWGAEEQASMTRELQGFLRNKLPEYMVPSVFVQLETLPLTANGKVDRRSLPLPEAMEKMTATVFVAPATELEQMMAGIWQEVLQVEKVGIHDNFFDLGGTSVHLVRVHARLREVAEQELPIVKMFEYPTIQLLIQYTSRQTDEQAVLQQSQEHAQARKARRQLRQQRRQQSQLLEAENTPQDDIRNTQSQKIIYQTQYSKL